MAPVSVNLLMKWDPKAVSPELSPDGEEVLYTQKVNGKEHIFKLGVNSGVRTQLTRPRFKEY